MPNPIQAEPQPMETQAVKTVKRMSWQGFAMFLSTLLGMLTLPEVRELVALYPEALTMLGVATLVITSATKIIDSYLKFKKELEKF